MASSLQAFIGSAANGVVAGVVAPLVMHSTIALAATSLAMMIVGVVAWLFVKPHLRLPALRATIGLVTVLLLGLIVFFGVHSVSIVAPGWRSAQIARRGERAWKGIYSIAAGVGLALLIVGYGMARREPVVLYTPPVALRHVALLLMLPVFPLLFAAYLPGRLSRAARHPMLLAVKLWATAHLLANGTLADVLLFGGFLAWAVADRISVKRRSPAAGACRARRAAGPMNDADRRRRRPGRLRADRLLGASLAVRRLAPALSAEDPAVPMASTFDLTFDVRAVSPVGHGLRRPDEPPRRPGGARRGRASSRPTRRRRRRRCSTSSRATPWSRPARRCASTTRPASSRSAPRSASSSAAPPARVGEAEALDFVAGYVIVADCSLPHDSYFRPAIRFKARDGFVRHRPEGRRARRHRRTPMRSASASWSTAGRCTPTRTGGTFRGVARLVSDVSEFMTLAPGDVLLTGVRAPARRGSAPARRWRSRSTASAGSRPASSPARGAGRAMKRARVAYAGALHEATPGAAPGTLRLADGRVVAEEDVVWLAPFEVGTDHRARPQLRRPCQGAGLQRPGRAAGVPQGTRLADRPPRPDAPPGRRDLHALRMRARGGDRQAGAQGQPRRGDVACRRLHRRQRLRDPRLPRELVPAEPARQEPRRRHRARALAGRRRRRRRAAAARRCAPSSTAGSRSRATPAT